MSVSTTIARPYAKAIFNIAKHKSEFDEWDNILSYLSLIAENKNGIFFIKNKTIGHEKKAQIINDILISKNILNDNIKILLNNFIKTLAYYNRLIYVKDIKDIYIKYVNIYLSKIEAHIEIANNITQELKDEILKCLTKKFNKEISAVFQINESLIGGFLIKIEDSVLDASILGNLNSLKNKIIV